MLKFSLAKKIVLLSLMITILFNTIVEVRKAINKFSDIQKRLFPW